MGQCVSCLDEEKKQEMKEEERLAAAEVRARAAEAAQKRQEQFEKSAAGRAARAQQQGIAKQASNTNKGEPVLMVLLLAPIFLMFSCFSSEVANGWVLSIVSVQSNNCLL
ncbi:uncharacterized protein LOC133819392 isoform X3 [Humulus lupulus]|uniref:uncharacterized protein LOC133819392 isoform X3 n=1 Tax=Humulus lupulus TaxID=3486 RepID=UPI002B414584|nr:uncharacterized protein LOC133819392 isoform X3 [Humulus lupulus]